MKHPFSKLSHVDPILLAATLGLLGLGTVMIYSASCPPGLDRYADGAYFLKRRLLAMGIGLAAMGTLFFAKARWLRLMALPGLILAGTLLAVTLFTSVGVAAKTSTRWLGLGGVIFQPSELAKPLLINYVAAYLARKREGVRDFAKGLLPLLLTVGAVAFLILRQPDFGTAVMLLAVVGAMLFVARAKLWHLGALAGLALAGGWALIQAAPYRQRRLSAFLTPWDDPYGSGFQIIQSFVAFRRGGLEGQGLGDGAQQLLYLPEAHTDFIFSVVAEELGLLGSLGVLFLFAAVVVQGLRLAMRLKEPFASLLAFGLTAAVGFHALCNMAMVMGLLPTKGMTLPLLSYGGTSLISTMASVGVLLSLSASVSMSRNRFLKGAAP